MGSGLSWLFRAGCGVEEASEAAGELTIYDGGEIQIPTDVCNSGTDSGRLYWSCADGIIQCIDEMAHGSGDPVQINLGQRYS